MLNGEGSLGEGLVSAVAHSHVSKPLHTAMRWRMEWAVGGGAWRCVGDDACVHEHRRIGAGSEHKRREWESTTQSSTSE